MGLGLLGLGFRGLRDLRPLGLMDLWILGSTFLTGPVNSKLRTCKKAGKGLGNGLRVRE